MRKNNRRKNPEELNFWQSYSDMMAALLLVFVLIIAFTIIQAKVTYEEKETKLEQQKTELEQKNKELEKQNEEIIEFKKQVKKQEKQLDMIIGVRSQVVKELEKEFEDSNLDMSIDAETGTICFDSSVLFGYNEHKLKKTGIKFLNKFFPKYFDVILKNSIRDYIAEVIIEGHTDDSGGYLYNLDLSQKRAFAVAEYCLGEKNHMFSRKKLEKVREIVTANGRSYYELKYNSKGKVDAKASRRVEVKFRLTEEEMIQEVSNILKE